MNLYAIKLWQSLWDHVVVGLIQSPSNKVLQRALFKKQNLRFALVGGQFGSLEFHYSVSLHWDGFTFWLDLRTVQKHYSECMKLFYFLQLPYAHDLYVSVPIFFRFS